MVSRTCQKPPTSFTTANYKWYYMDFIWKVVGLENQTRDFLDDDDHANRSMSPYSRNDKSKQNIRYCRKYISI